MSLTLKLESYQPDIHFFVNRRAVTNLIAVLAMHFPLFLLSLTISTRDNRAKYFLRARYLTANEGGKRRLRVSGPASDGEQGKGGKKQKIDTAF